MAGVGRAIGPISDVGSVITSSTEVTGIGSFSFL